MVGEGGLTAITFFDASSFQCPQGPRLKCHPGGRMARLARVSEATEAQLGDAAAEKQGNRCGGVGVAMGGGGGGRQ